MRELCSWCLGIGKVHAERFHYRDLNDTPIRGLVPCKQCAEAGHIDWRSHEITILRRERHQAMLRKAVDLGGSVYSRESRVFNVTEVRWNAISSVYFSPKKISEMLELIFPGDLEDIEAAVMHASYSAPNAWRVTPRTSDRRHIARCKAIELQLRQQFPIDQYPEFAKPLEVDDRTVTRFTHLKTDIHHLRRGIAPVTSWREAVAAVKAQTRDAEAA